MQFVPPPAPINLRRGGGERHADDDGTGSIGVTTPSAASMISPESRHRSSRKRGARICIPGRRRPWLPLRKDRTAREYEGVFNKHGPPRWGTARWPTSRGPTSKSCRANCSASRLRPTCVWPCCRRCLKNRRRGGGVRNTQIRVGTRRLRCQCLLSSDLGPLNCRPRDPPAHKFLPSIGATGAARGEVNYIPVDFSKYESRTPKNGDRWLRCPEGLRRR